MSDECEYNHSMQFVSLNSLNNVIIQCCKSHLKVQSEVGWCKNCRQDGELRKNHT